MINTKDFSQLIRQLRPIMPEESRTELAIRVAEIFQKAISAGNNVAAFADWANNGLARFLNDCQLGTTARPAAPWDFQVESSTLAAFCAKWMSVSEFKLIDEPEGELRPISVEMNGLRVSMINELKSLAGLPVDEVAEEINYTAAIADAADAYRNATTEHELTRSNETQRAKALAYEKLTWMQDARRNGWNPADYQPEV